MRVFKAIRGFLQGVWEAQKTALARPLLAAKVHNDDALMFILFGDFLGYPFPPTLYSKMLLVYYVDRMIPWQKRIMKEKDILAKR